MTKPVDLVKSQIDEIEQRREQAWAAMKQMHDDANGTFDMIAAGGWCAPTQVVYPPSSWNMVSAPRVPLRDKIQMATVLG